MKIPKVGRPLKFQSVEEMEKLINAYFESCFAVNEETGEAEQIEPFTVTGLALAVGTDRHGLIEYAERPEFSHTIKKAKSFIENYAEKSALTSRNPAGAIFILKNHGWSDTQKLELTGADGGPVEVEVSSAELARRARELIGD